MLLSYGIHDIIYEVEKVTKTYFFWGKVVQNMKPFSAIKNFISRYKHSFILLYFFVYLIWFFKLEHTVTTHFNKIYSKLDDYIPFCEVFIIPYFLWFIYIAVTILFFIFASKNDFYKLCANLFIGMTICLIIYTIWPNGHNLRVDLHSLGRSNIFTQLLSYVYTVDTATNVFPSIHVFNSVAAYIAIKKNEQLKKYKWIQSSALILTTLICMSTVLLKQHSILDILGAFALNIAMYFIVYVPDWKKILEARRARRELSNI